MITQQESGLTSDQYTALLAARGDPTYRITLEQYTPLLSSHDIDGAPTPVDCFDVAQCGTNLVRAYCDTADEIEIDVLTIETDTPLSWSSQTLVASGIDDSVILSLGVTGDTIRVFWYNSSSILYHESTDNGVTWGAAQTVGAVSNVFALAATSTTRVHYLVETTSDNARFYVYNYSGSWSSTASPIYWPVLPTAFDAIAGPQTDPGAEDDNDILVFATDYPPIISAKVVGTEYTNYLIRTQGLAAMRFQNGQWSEHVAIDVVDRSAVFPSRYNVKLTDYDGWIFLAYTRIDGEFDAYKHEAIAISRSRTGLEWEHPYLLEAVLDSAAVAIHCNTWVYLLDSTTCYRSQSVGYFGDPQITIDVTDYASIVITDAGQIQNVRIGFENPGQVLDNLDVFTNDGNLQVRVEIGYWVGGEQLLVQTLLADVHSVGEALTIPVVDLELNGADDLSRLTSVSSDQAIEWDSQIVGGDNFRSSDGTDYSGLRRTAGQEGSWKAPDGTQELLLTSNEKPGTAFNTYCSYTWNGSCQAAIQVAATDSNDYAGIIFRCYDKRNLLALRYNADDDVIELIDRKDNVEVRLTAGSAKSWSVETWYWLKVVFRYNYVWAYASTDGITWVQEFTYEIPGIPSGAAWAWSEFTGRSIPNMDGRMGYCGAGYSDEDDYYPPIPPEIPVEPPTDDVDLGQVIIGVTIPPVYGTTPQYQAGAFYTNNFSSASPTWYAMNDGLEANGSKRLYDMKIMEWASGRKTVFGATYCGMYEYESLPAPYGSWQTRIRTSYMAGQLSIPLCVLEHISLSLEEEGLGAALYSYSPGVGLTEPGGTIGVLVSEDGFKTEKYITPIIDSLPHENYGYRMMGSTVCFAQHSGGNTIYVGVSWSNPTTVNSAIYRSTNRGSSYTLLKSWSAARASGPYPCYCKIFVPYHSETWGDSTIYCALYLGAGGYDGFWVSYDHGATWAQLSTTGGAKFSLMGASYDRSKASFASGDHLYYWNGSALTDYNHAPGGGVTTRACLITSRSATLAPAYYIILAEQFGMGGYGDALIYYRNVVAGSNANKTGNLQSLTPISCPAWSIAYQEHPSVPRQY